MQIVRRSTFQPRSVALALAVSLALGAGAASLPLSAQAAAKAVTVAQLKEARGYVIVGAFVLGAIFTPPDIISQFMLAVPLWLLFELGLLAAPFLQDKKIPTAENTIHPNLE